MKLFYKTEKPDVETIQKIADIPMGRNKKAGDILGFAGVFCFYLPDIYVSDSVEKILHDDLGFSETLQALLKRVRGMITVIFPLTMRWKIWRTVILHLLHGV